MSATQVAASCRFAAASQSRPASRRAPAAFAMAAPAQRLASVSSISAAGSLAPAAAARAPRCRAAAALSVRSEITCELRCTGQGAGPSRVLAALREPGLAQRRCWPCPARPGLRCFHALARPCAPSLPDVMIKPDGVQRGLVGEIISRFEKKGFTLVQLKMMKVTK